MALRIPHIALTLAVLTAAAPAPVLAQSSNSDLIGSRAAGADTELQARGYRSGHGGTGRNDSRYVFWRRGDDCIQVLTRDGRVAAVTPSAIGYCSDISSSSSSSGSNAGAVVAGVAIIGLAAALAAHNSHHHDAGADHDREYDRGYRAAMDGDDYDARSETEGYHEGFLAGEDEGRNRRYSDSRFVRGASDAARQACSRRADEFQNRPRGSSVPISVRDLGRGMYELTMATGSYRSRCVVNSDGDVREMTPY
jgi:hypothetical protein